MQIYLSNFISKKKVFLISDMCQLSTDANHLSDAQHIQNKQEVAQK